MASTAPQPETIIDKVCVVTGGGSGIGAALCQRFAAVGARCVVVADINGAAAKSVASTLNGKGVAFECNVAREQDMQRLIETAEAQGPIGVFACNAGVAGSPGGVEVSNEVWQRTYDINVTQNLYCARHLIPRWKTQPGKKHFIFTVSAAGLLTEVGSLSYSVTKHAALGFAEWCAIAYQDIGVQVCCLCPQAVDTGMLPKDSAGKPLSVAAGVDGILSPDKVSECVVEAMVANRFLVLPHPSVKEYFRRKGDDYDRWLGGMRKVYRRYGSTSSVVSKL